MSNEPQRNIIDLFKFVAQEQLHRKELFQELEESIYIEDITDMDVQRNRYIIRPICATHKYGGIIRLTSHYKNTKYLEIV